MVMTSAGLLKNYILLASNKVHKKFKPPKQSLKCPGMKTLPNLSFCYYLQGSYICLYSTITSTPKDVTITLFLIVAWSRSIRKKFIVYSNHQSILFQHLIFFWGELVYFDVLSSIQRDLTPVFVNSTPFQKVSNREIQRNSTQL